MSRSVPRRTLHTNPTCCQLCRVLQGKCNRLWRGDILSRAVIQRRERASFSTSMEVPRLLFPKLAGRTPPPPPIAPTFLWASRIGAVTSFHKNHLHKAQIKILEAECTSKGAREVTDLYGQVYSGFLKIRGHLTTATFHPSKCGKCHTQLWQDVEPHCNVMKDGHPPNFSRWIAQRMMI